MDHLFPFFFFRIWNLRQQFKKMPIQNIWELGDSQKDICTYSVRRIFKNSCATSFCGWQRCFQMPHLKKIRITVYQGQQSSSFVIYEGISQKKVTHFSRNALRIRIELIFGYVQCNNHIGPDHLLLLSIYIKQHYRKN